MLLISILPYITWLFFEIDAIICASCTTNSLNNVRDFDSGNQNNSFVLQHFA